MEYRMYFDSNGRPKADFSASSEEYGLFGLFLSMELGRSIFKCDELIHIIEDVVTGSRQGFRGTGNLFTLIIGSKEVQIKNAFAEIDESASLELQEFMSVLQDWRHLIYSSDRNAEISH